MTYDFLLFLFNAVLVGGLVTFVQTAPININAREHANSSSPASSVNIPIQTTTLTQQTPTITPPRHEEREIDD